MTTCKYISWARWEVSKRIDRVHSLFALYKLSLNAASLVCLIRLSPSVFIMHMHNSLHSDRLTKKSSLDKHLISSTIAPILGLVSGALAGGVEASVTYPLDFAKTQAQLRFNRRWRHIDTTTFIRRTVAADGISALYTGLGSAVYGSALKVGLRYLVFDGTVHALKDHNGKSGNLDYAAAGITAGVVESVVIATPSERIKTAMIDDSNGAKRYKSTTDAVHQIFRAEGVSGIYRGLVSTTCKYAGTGAVKMGSKTEQRSPMQNELHFDRRLSCSIAAVQAAS